MGAILVAVSALGFSTNPIFAKLAYAAGANVITLGVARFSMAAAALWLYLLARRQAGGLSVWKRLQLLLLGIVGMAIVSLLYFSALPHIDASLATGIFYLHPAMIALVGLFRGERLGRLGLAGLLLTGAGTWLLLDGGTGGFTWQGLMMIVGAAAIYSAYMIIGERWTTGVSAVVTSAHVTLASAVFYLVIALASGQSAPPPMAILAAGSMAICSTILALITFFAGLPGVGPTRAAVISTLEPVFTALLAVTFLGERLTLPQLGGVAVVVAGAIAVQLRERSTVAAQA